jgi:hypothetical protein
VTGFRFGVNLTVEAGGAQWRETCRRAERLGYDVLLVPDHLGAPAPFHRLPYLTDEQIADLPMLLIGTAEQVADDLLRHRERYGVSYQCVLQPAMTDFAPVIELLRGR